VLQCVAVCCSVLQCVAVCCSVLQCVAACCSVLQCVAVYCSSLAGSDVSKRNLCIYVYTCTYLFDQPNPILLFPGWWRHVYTYIRVYEIYVYIHIYIYIYPPARSVMAVLWQVVIFLKKKKMLTHHSVKKMHEFSSASYYSTVCITQHGCVLHFCKKKVKFLNEGLTVIE